MTSEFALTGMSYQLVIVLPDNCAWVSCCQDFDVQAAFVNRQFQLMHVLNVLNGKGFEPRKPGPSLAAPSFLKIGGDCKIFLKQMI